MHARLTQPKGELCALDDGHLPVGASLFPGGVPTVVISFSHD
jgi:hypothetical protein